MIHSFMGWRLTGRNANWASTGAKPLLRYFASRCFTIRSLASGHKDIKPSSLKSKSKSKSRVRNSYDVCEVFQARRDGNSKLIDCIRGSTIPVCETPGLRSNMCYTRQSQKFRLENPWKLGIGSAFGIQVWVCKDPTSATWATYATFVQISRVRSACF
jgi:hypothetical protein